MPELNRPTQAELDRMSHAENDALIAALFDLLGQHERRLSELESQVKKTSRNSSQPPSAGGLRACPVRPLEPGQKGRVKQHPATNLLLRLRDYKTEVWRFMTDWWILFDHNRAERLVRQVKVKLKTIGGFRTLGDFTAFCILRSVWETNKLNGINQLDTLRLTFEGR